MTARDDLLLRLEAFAPSVTGPSLIPRQPTNQQLVDAAITEATRSSRVQGRCPACRHSALFLGDGGYITCGNLQCTDPEAATDMLEQP